MARAIRRGYYNIFSKFYDKIIAMHSKDARGRLRMALAKKSGVSTGDIALDICTGTGAVLPSLSKCVGDTGLVIGLDFSSGMLSKARERINKAGLNNVSLVLAEADHLPFNKATFKAVTCSHAFYELKGDVRQRSLEEIKRVLLPGGRFCMMEHELPKSGFIRFLFYIRMLVAGGFGFKKALAEEPVLFSRHFSQVNKEILPGGNTKVICGANPVHNS